MKSKLKGISPLIATVLLIAFTVAIGGLLSVWLSSLTSTQTSTVSTSVETGSKCADSVLQVKEVRFKCPNVEVVNTTILYSTGSEVLYNLTLEITGGGSTNRSTILTRVFPGSFISNNTNVSTVGTNRPTCPYEVIRVSAVCGNTTTSPGSPVIGECKSGNTCYKRS